MPGNSISPVRPNATTSASTTTTQSAVPANPQAASSAPPLNIDRETLRAANPDDPILCATPWKLARDGGLAGLQEWPRDLFEGFLEIVQDGSIIESKGSHHFLDVLYHYRGKLSDAQKRQLLDALKDPRGPICVSPAHARARYRLQEFLERGSDVFAGELHAAVELARKGIPVAIGAATSYFRTFRMEPEGRKTRCTVSTDMRPEGFTITVDISAVTLERLLKANPPPRKGYELISSNIASAKGDHYVIERTSEALQVLPLLDDQRRLDTLLDMPGALAESQSMSIWSEAVFNALFGHVLPEMERYKVPAQDRFRSIFDALCGGDARGDATRLHLPQQRQVRRWLQENIDNFRDDETRQRVVQFIVDGMGRRDEARMFFEELLPSQEAMLEAQKPGGDPALLQRTDNLARFANAGLRYLAQPEQKMQPQTPKNLRSRVSGSFSSLAEALTPRSKVRTESDAESSRSFSPMHDGSPAPGHYRIPSELVEEPGDAFSDGLRGVPSSRGRRSPSASSFGPQRSVSAGAEPAPTARGRRAQLAPPLSPLRSASADAQLPSPDANSEGKNSKK